MKTINEIGQEYGVHPGQVGDRKKEILEQAKALFEGKRGPKPLVEHKEPELLYSEIGKLMVELDWLKKSLGCSCHEQADVDRPRGYGSRGSTMRFCRRIARHLLCAEGARPGG